MTLAKVYVDFSRRDPAGRLYLANLDRLPMAALGQRFIGTDYDEFEVECEVLAIDHAAGDLYHRPVRPWEVPGTFTNWPLPTFVNCRVSA